MALVTAFNLGTQSEADQSIDKHSFWLNKTYPSQAFDGVMVGDSRLYRGFSPARIEAKLPGVTLHNFGYSSARLTPDLLNAALAHLDPKSATPFVVLALTAHSLTAPKQGSDNPHYDGFAQRNRATVWLSQRGAWISRKAWPAWIKDPTDGLLMARQGAGSVAYHESFDARGFVASVTTPKDPQRALKSYRKLLTASPVQEARLVALANWVRETTSKGIRVIAMVPPRAPAMEELERQAGGWSKEAVKARLKTAGAQWIDMPWTNLSSYDGSHLDPPSAERVSDQLGQALRPLLAR